MVSILHFYLSSLPSSFVVLHRFRKGSSRIFILFGLYGSTVYGFSSGSSPTVPGRRHLRTQSAAAMNPREQAFLSARNFSGFLPNTAISIIFVFYGVCCAYKEFSCEPPSITAAVLYAMQINLFGARCLKITPAISAPWHHYLVRSDADVMQPMQIQGFGFFHPPFVGLYHIERVAVHEPCAIQVF